MGSFGPLGEVSQVVAPAVELGHAFKTGVHSVGEFCSRELGLLLHLFRVQVQLQLESVVFFDEAGQCEVEIVPGLKVAPHLFGDSFKVKVLYHGCLDGYKLVFEDRRLVVLVFE